MLGNGGVDEELSSGSRERVLEGGDAIVGLGLTVGLGSSLYLALFFAFFTLFISYFFSFPPCGICVRRRLALQMGSLAVPRLNALRTMAITPFLNIYMQH